MFVVTSTRTMQVVAKGYATRAEAHVTAETYERLLGGVYIVEEVPERTVIRTALVKNPRTENQIKDTVRTLNRKLAKLITWRGIPTTLYTLTAALDDGAIAIRLAEPDRTMTDQPDKVWAEVFLDVNQSSVSLYRHGKTVYLEGLTAAVAASYEAYAKANETLNGK